MMSLTFGLFTQVSGSGPLGPLVCMVVFMQRFNVSGCQKTVSETQCYLSTKIERPTYLLTLTSAQRITISIFL